VRLIGCAMAIAWPDLGADRRSASGRMRRSVFASRETFWRVRGGETWDRSRYDFLRVRRHNTEPHMTDFREKNASTPALRVCSSTPRAARTP
jgi:hypothetical protein